VAIDNPMHRREPDPGPRILRRGVEALISSSRQSFVEIELSVGRRRELGRI
jgi:hypothetical protein